MKALLGELPCESGKILIASKRMAYCSQSPWLLNTSIQQSITGLAEQSAIDEQWYRSVVTACALDEDISQFPDGDQSVIGSRGFTLSGGQKQRLALARTVYTRPDIALLDDVLSALDAKTERLVVDRLLGPRGLFRKCATTVVLVTHSTRHFALANYILVLSADGHISQQGSYEELRAQPGFISSAMHEPTPEDEQNGTSSNSKVLKELKGPSEEEALDLARKTGDISVYKYYLQSIPLVWSLLFFGSCVGFAFCFNFPQIWLKLWADAEGEDVAKYISVYVLLGCCAIVTNFGYLSTILVKITPESGARLHFNLLRTVMRAPQSFFASTDTGETLNRFSQDMTLVDHDLPVSFLVVAVTLAEVIAQTALIATGSTYMAITIPFFLIGLYLLQKVYLRTSRQLRFMDLEAKSPVYSHFLETLEGVATIRAFGWQHQANQTNIKRLDASQRPYYLLYCIQRWLNLVLDLIVAALAIIVVTLAVQLRSSTNAGLIGIALNNILTFNQGLSGLVNYWTQLETSLGAIARLKSFEAKVLPEAKAGEDVIPPESWPEAGAVEFQQVSASYNPDTRALQNVTLKVEPGYKIGICGRTGSGKSTLLSTLLRLLDLDSGAIKVDGYDLSVIPREIIRTRMIAIPQDPFILSGTVRLNAEPTSLCTNEEITSALEKVRLWPVLLTRGGLDADLKEQPLSHGQQQLFCLARAMLRNGRILILDEATSNVDGESDRLMQKIIREEFGKHTILTVAHRLETIMDADRVVVMDEGRIVEVGEPGELLKDEGSRFRRLHGW